MKLHLIPLVLALSSTAALAAPTYDLASRTNSSAQTASTAGATNAGNAQSINSYAPANSTLRTNPSIGVPSGAAAFSNNNCANIGSLGGSGLFGALAALAGSFPIESDECNGRANATILMQMANALNAMPGTDMHAMASALVMSAIGVMCDQDDKLRAKLAGHGLCDHYDYDGNKRHYHVYRGDALGYYPE